MCCTLYHQPGVLTNWQRENTASTEQNKHNIYWQCVAPHFALLSEEGQTVNQRYSITTDITRAVNKEVGVSKELKNNSVKGYWLRTLYFFLPHGSTAPNGPGLHDNTQDAPQSVVVLCTSDRPDAETSIAQYSQQTDIHALGGIRIHNPSKRATADLRPRPRGHRDRRYIVLLRFDSREGQGNSPFVQNIQTQRPIQKGTGGRLPRGKNATALTLPLNSIQFRGYEWVEL